MADRVFDDRLGLWVVDADRGVARLPGIRAFGVRDVFLPRTAERAHFASVRAAGLNAHLAVSADDLGVTDFAARTLADMERLEPGAVELNIELRADEGLRAYFRSAVQLMRSAKRRLRMRLNIAPYKAFALPIDLLRLDPNLYVCEQSFYGDMSRVSEADALYDLLAYGVPLGKATVCYGAAALVPDPSAREPMKPVRRVGLGTRWTWSDGQVVRPLTRGVIFQDDLMADVGLL